MSSPWIPAPPRPLLPSRPSAERTYPNTSTPVVGIHGRKGGSTVGAVDSVRHVAYYTFSWSLGMVEGGGVRRVIPHTPPCSTCWGVSPRTHSQICTCHALRCIALAVTCYHSTTHRRSMASTDVQSMRGGEGQGGNAAPVEGGAPQAGVATGGDRWWRAGKTEAEKAESGSVRHDASYFVSTLTCILPSIHAIPYCSNDCLSVCQCPLINYCF